jgi:hypothetical protein
MACGWIQQSQMVWWYLFWHCPPPWLVPGANFFVGPQFQKYAASIRPAGEVGHVGEGVFVVLCHQVEPAKIPTWSPGAIIFCTPCAMGWTMQQLRGLHTTPATMKHLAELGLGGRQPRRVQTPKQAARLNCWCARAGGSHDAAEVGQAHGCSQRHRSRLYSQHNGGLRSTEEDRQRGGFFYNHTGDFSSKLEASPHNIFNCISVINTFWLTHHTTFKWITVLPNNVAENLLSIRQQKQNTIQQ